IFIFYFPSLLAGPIDRWPRFRQALKDSFTAPRVPSLKLAYQFLLLGLAQKFVLAEALRRYVLPTSIENFRQGIIGFYSYPLYLYLDFAGYSALAIGFSLLLGVSLPLNFDRPYLAQNPQDFWRRFHITLGEWLRDYFFKPLYLLLSKRKALAPYPLLRQNLALFSTFFLMGLWNGTQKHFLISGALFGAYSVVHNIFVYRAKQKGIRFLSPAFVWLSRFVMLHAACLALFIFCQQMWEKH
ncbi:MAG TPA: MBOAT family O-acyltransferase, partial [Bdellovibrionales bacterium]|nr:MBOAT family O-acyltransferase [Bdellovibrionales bacterium]